MRKLSYVLIIFSFIMLFVGCDNREKPYTITYELDGGINNSNNLSEIVSDDLPFDLHKPTKDGYLFKGWYNNGEEVKKISEIGNITLSAKWEEEAYLITYFLDQGTNNSNNLSEFKMSDLPVSLNDPLKNGYEFMGWYLNDDFNGGGIDSINEVGDISLYAKWEESFSIGVSSVLLTHYDVFRRVDLVIGDTRYSVSVSSNNAELGEVLASQTSDNTYGAKGVVRADELGADFLFWKENGKIVSRDKEYEFFITKNHELVAYFVPSDKYAIIYLDTNDYLIDLQFIDKGGDLINTELTPIEKLGFNFIGYDRVDEVEGHVYIYAKYETTKAEYKVLVNNGFLKNTEDNEVELEFGSEVIVEAKSSNFSYWEIDGKIVSYENVYAFTVLRSTTINAVLEGNKGKKFSCNLQDFLVEEGKLLALGGFVNPNNLAFIESGFIISFGKENKDKTISSWTNVYEMRSTNISDYNEFVLAFDLENEEYEMIHICSYVKTDNGTETKPVYVTHYSNIVSYDFS